MKNRGNSAIVFLIVFLISILIFPTKAFAEDYRAWSQSDSRWGSVKMGSTTVGKDGCLVTSVTKLAVQAGIKDSSSFNPGIMANELTNTGGFTADGDLYWDSARSVAGFSSVHTGVMSWNDGGYSSSTNNDTLMNYIRQGYHMVLCVNSGSHWIAVDERKSLDTGTIYIMDSLSSEENADIILSSRYSKFYMVNAFKGGSTPSTTSHAKLTASYAVDGIALSWEETSGAAGYWVYRSTSEDGSYGCIAETTSRSYVDKSVSPGVKYYYKVQPFNSNRDGMNYSSVASYIANSKLTYVYSDTNGISLYWSETADAAGYWVYRSTSENGSYECVGEKTDTSYKEQTLSAGEKYYYKVQPFNSKRQGMNYTNTISITVGEFMTPTISNVLVSGQNVTVEWEPVEVAAKYYVQLCNEDWSKTWWYDTTGTSWTFQNLADGIWQFRVNSEDKDGNSANEAKYHYFSLGIPDTPMIEDVTVNEKNISIKWKECKNAVRYRIEIVNEAGESTWYENAKNPFVIENMKLGKYTYKIQALNTKGDMRESEYHSFEIGCRHSWDEGIVIQEATCQEEGEIEFTCCYCQEIKKDVIAVNPDAHVWDKNSTYDEEPTCTENGTKSIHCSLCKTRKAGSEEEVAALGHDFSEQWIIDKEATCLETGSKSYHCSRCEARINETVIEKAGHTEVIDEAEEASCTATGLTEGKHCSVCKEILIAQEIIPVKDHSWDKGTVDESGEKIFACMKCGKEIFFGITDILPTSYNKLTIQWSKFEGSEGYIVYKLDELGKYSIVKTLSGADTTTYIHTVSSGVKYTYKVAAYQLIGAKKNIIAETTDKVGVAALAAPKVTSANMAAYNKIRIQWTKVSGCEGYVIYRNTSEDGAYSVLKTVAQATATEYVNVVTSSEDYYYKIRAFVTVNGKKMYGDYSNILMGNVISGSPANFKVEQTTETRVDFMWDKVDDADGYVLYMSSDAEGTYKAIKNVTDKNVLTYKKTITPSEKYYFYMKAYRNINGKKVYSQASEKISNK